MSALARAFITPEEYLALERASERKSEYFLGEVFAMGGASREHNLIVGNVVRDLGNQLKGRPCETYPSDMRVKVSASGLYTYPDVAVVCGQPQFEDAQVDTLLNPTLVIEVLSESTEAYDRGEKFAQYRSIESLQEYVLISQDRCQVERLVRQPNGREWLYSEASDPAGSVPLAAIGCRLSLTEVYERVEFPDRPPGPPPEPRGR